MEGLKVVPIGVQSLYDIPGSLRELANRIESGTEPEASQCIVVILDKAEGIRVLGYGEIGTVFHTIGILNVAASGLANFEQCSTWNILGNTK